MKKFKSLFSKKLNLKSMFNSNNKNNPIISIVALIQCVILIVLTAYSWIESSSSLVIKGENLPISSNLNYRFDVQESGTTSVDLSTYFRPTALYQFAHCSSVDGENFYFKKEGQSTYRKGDTTDYNTSYYNLDFQVHNTTAKNFNYFFESANIFTVTSEDEAVTNEIKTTVADAMRVCVTSGTAAKTSLLFSKEERDYDAVYNTSGDLQNIKPKKLLGSNYVYNGSNPEGSAIFKSTHGGEDTKVNVKIWFEEKDPDWVALPADQKQAALGCTIKINLKFMNSASDFQTIMFDDYTFSNVAGHEGKPMTTEDANSSLYFCYTGGSSIEIVPMMITENDGGTLRWITSDGQGNAAPRISKDIIDDISLTPANGYFYYGSISSKGQPIVRYKWAFDANTKPMQNDGGSYIYQALSVTKNSANASVGFGVWGNKQVELIQFVDRTTANTTNAYNSFGYQFVVKGGNESLYLNDSGLYETQTTRMYYDALTDTWKGYYLVECRNNLKFMYSTDSRCGNNIKCVWSATDPALIKDKTVYTYTALGYSDNGVLNNFASSSTKAGTTSGVGTWGEVEMIKLSAELMDIGINKDYRYKVGLASGTTYYYMARHYVDHHYFAYVMKDYGDSAANALAFQYLDSPTQTQAGATLNVVNPALRDLSDTYYLTGRNTGQWHIGVVVDGSATNVVNDTLTSVTGSKLEWSTDMINWYEMIKLDNYRWHTGDFVGSTDKLYYRYTAYPNSSASAQDGAVFSYGHDRDNGIYLNITE